MTFSAQLTFTGGFPSASRHAAPGAPGDGRAGVNVIPQKPPRQKFHLVFAKGLSTNRYRLLRFLGVSSPIRKF
jgi:hypothetical protein